MKEEISFALTNKTKDLYGEDIRLVGNLSKSNMKYPHWPNNKE